MTLAYQGTELLERTTVRLGQGRRYGLIGPNGVGKTTLLRRIAAGAVPGWPLHLRSYLVQQEEMVGAATFYARVILLAFSLSRGLVKVMGTDSVMTEIDPLSTAIARQWHILHVFPRGVPSLYRSIEPLYQIVFEFSVQLSLRCELMTVWIHRTRDAPAPVTSRPGILPVAPWKQS